MDPEEEEESSLSFDRFRDPSIKKCHTFLKRYEVNINLLNQPESYDQSILFRQRVETNFRARFVLINSVLLLLFNLAICVLATRAVLGQKYLEFKWMCAYVISAAVSNAFYAILALFTGKMSYYFYIVRKLVYFEQNISDEKFLFYTLVYYIYFSKTFFACFKKVLKLINIQSRI